MNTLAQFDGSTFVQDRDGCRLSAQLHRVKELMRDGEWRTLEQIALECSAPQASVSARLRDLRKAKFGGWQVERQYVERGLFMYRAIPTFKQMELLKP